MSLGRIIREKRELLNLTLDEVSRQAGFSKPYLSTIETERVNNPPSDDLLRKLEHILGFKPGTLLHIAHVEGLPSDIRQNYEAAQAENKKLRTILKNIIRKKTDPSKIKALLIKQHLTIEEQSVSVAAGQMVPVINRVHAGYPADFNDLDYPAGIADDYVRCPDIHDPNAFAVRVVGDSMEPKFKEGDIVIFSPAAEAKNGDDCFVRFTMPHETTFKRVFFEKDNKIRLQPRNEKYPPMVVDGKRINGLYKVVGRYEKF